jgi:hypothetical protein
MSNLKSWSHEKFGDVNKELTSIRKMMEELEALDLNANQTKLKGLRNMMDELLYKEDMMWLQRSRVAWLKEGDRNTKYFHRKAAGRVMKNKAKHLKN